VIKEACYVMDSLNTKCPKLQIACHHDSAVFWLSQHKNLLLIVFY